jgi:hypothetical protein
MLSPTIFLKEEVTLFKVMPKLPTKFDNEVKLELVELKTELKDPKLAAIEPRVIDKSRVSN